MRNASWAAVFVAVTSFSPGVLAQTTPSGNDDTEAPAPKPKPAAQPAAAPAATSATRDYVWLGVGGLVTFGASWIGTIVLAAATDAPDKGLAIGHSVVPVGGPFLSIAEASHAPDIEGGLAILGVLQGLGVGATLLGFTLESKVDIGDQSAWVAPLVSPGALGVQGRF